MPVATLKTSLEANSERQNTEGKKENATFRGSSYRSAQKLLGGWVLIPRISTHHLKDGHPQSTGPLTPPPFQNFNYAFEPSLSNKKLSLILA